MIIPNEMYRTQKVGTAQGIYLLERPGNHFGAKQLVREDTSPKTEKYKCASWPLPCLKASSPCSVAEFEIMETIDQLAFAA